MILKHILLENKLLLGTHIFLLLKLALICAALYWSYHSIWPSSHLLFRCIIICMVVQIWFVATSNIWIRKVLVFIIIIKHFARLLKYLWFIHLLWRWTKNLLFVPYSWISHWSIQWLLANIDVSWHLSVVSLLNLVLLGQHLVIVSTVELSDLCIWWTVVCLLMRALLILSLDELKWLFITAT